MVRARILALALAPLPAVPEAAGGELRDVLYAHHASKQREPLPAYIHHVAAPALGFPALVPYAGRIEVVLVALPAGLDAGRLRLSIATRPAPGVEMGFPLRVVSVEPIPAGLRLEAAVPGEAPRDVYDLRVEGPGIDETAPRAVRVYGELRPDFTVVAVADQQLWDPSWFTGRAAQRFAGDYPRRGEADANRAIMRQEMHEIDLLDPDFVLALGDLVYGLDYRPENDEMRRLWSRSPFATFMVPGNHDGYAGYEVRLDLGPGEAVRTGLRCGPKMAGEMTIGKLAAFVTCVWGGVQPNLFHELTQDGLEHFRRTFGPGDFAFAHGPFLFVGLNTMDGTPERRHAFSFFLDAFDLHLGAPFVDNYGGTMSPAQLGWARRTMARGRAEGRTVVAFGHHDPRGNPPAIGPAYHVNQPFPTDPLSLEGFKEWNFDGAWDSDPRDGRGRESAEANSGIDLLAALADSAALYVSGHVHHDGDRRFAAGEALGPGVKARQPIDFARITTASGVPIDDGYWGYRILRADGRTFASQTFDRRARLASVPAGNLFVEPADATATTAVVHSGWPHTVTVAVRFALPVRAEGWRFADERGRDLPVREIAETSQGGRGGRQIFRVAVEMPAAPELAKQRKNMRRRTVGARPAAGNRPPVAELDVRSAVRGDAALRAGETVVLSSARTFDPDGDALHDTIFEMPDGAEARGAEASFVAAKAGRLTVALRARDGRGARARATREIEILDPPPVAFEPDPVPGATSAPSAGHPPAPAAGGCACFGHRQSGASGAGLTLPGAIGFVVIRRRRSARRI